MKEQTRRIWLYMAIMILTTLLVLCLGTLVGLVYIDERKVNEKNSLQNNHELTCTRFSDKKCSKWDHCGLFVFGLITDLPSAWR